MAKKAGPTIIGSMHNHTNTGILVLAQRLAEDVRDLLHTDLHQNGVERKADGSVVTEVDIRIQARVLAAIAEAYPDHAVRTEETLEDPEAHAPITAARYCWVIDPLDGTRNYLAGLPCYATSIAVLDRGRPVVGVVAEHNLGQVFAAASGDGATLNGRPISVGQPKSDGDLLVGVPSSKDRLTQKVVGRWLGIRGLVLRNLGSTALHLALVASGGLAATFCKQCKIWDIAAGALLITEAGGLITDPFGSDIMPFALGGDPDEDIPILAAPPGIHERLLGSIAAAGQ